MSEYDRLLDIAPSWVRYLVLRDLLEVPVLELAQSKKELLQDPYVQTLLASVANFHGPIVNTHKNASLNIHHLLLLLSLDLGTEQPQIALAVQQILEHRDSFGVYQSRVLVSEKLGGSGQPGFGWALCDAPLLLLAINQAGLNTEEYVMPGVEYLSQLQFELGFPCAVSKELGTWRGPGKKLDPCPMATLWMLKLYASLPAFAGSKQAKSLMENLLSLWQNSLKQNPYMFFMGTDFRKLKAPLVWYDIVSVSDTFRQFAWLSGDPRFEEMKSIIHSKKGPDGLFTPESIYMVCKDQDFGQKKLPSAYLSFLCMRILK
ncbi:MAG: hypothetical protein VB108_09835 [Anaerolineaceae bacterium]|nr:hypothetical protein [Anaerolineaceae bacterium]